MTGYPSSIARQVTGVSATQLSYWARTGLVSPSVSPGRGRGMSRLYSFRDLVQLAVVRRLLDAGLSVQRIRKAVAYLRKHFPDVAQPLAELTLLSDGRTVFHLTDDARVIVDTVRHGGQLVFSLAVGDLINELQHQLSAIPMEQEQKITVGEFEFPVRLTPDRQSGGYVVECPSLPGCISQGETVSESLRNIVSAAKIWLEVNAEEESRGSLPRLRFGRFRRGAAGAVKHRGPKRAAR